MLKKILLVGLTPLLMIASAHCADEAINIIPTPKELNVLAGKTPLDNTNATIVLGENADRKSILGAEEINKRMLEVGGKPLPVARGMPINELKGRTLIIIGTLEENGLLAKHLEQNKISIPDKIQGYVISRHVEEGDTTYILAGRDALGSLYACVSFRALIQKGDNGVYALNAEIKDWPDCATRSIIMRTNFNLGCKSYLSYLDWALRHKCNFIYPDTYSITNGDHVAPEDQKIISEIKKFNEYAEARGIEVMGGMFYWNVGYIPADKDNPAFKGCLAVGNGYWSLTRDDLIARKAEKIARYMKSAGVKNVLMHSRDGSPTGRWNDYGSDCKTRFGEDRAGADANFINITSKTIRNEVNGAKLFFVVEPYYGNIDIPENKPYKDYFARLTTLIPEDIYLVNADWNRESQDSWKNVIRQPVLQWRNIMIDPWNCGRDFSSLPCFAVKAGYYPGRDDIAYPNIHIGPGILEVLPLMSAEFMWNVDSPGCFMLHANASAKTEKSIENLYVYPMKDINGVPYEEWQWSKSTVEPKEVAYGLLPRVCEEAFGGDAAPIMSEILRMGIAKGILLMTGSAYKSPVYYNTFHDLNVIEDQYRKAQKAVAMLMEYKQTGKDFTKLDGVLRNMRIAAFGGKAHCHLLAAESCLKAKRPDEAQAELAKAQECLKSAEKELQKGEYAQLGAIAKATDSLSFRVNILAKSQEGKSSGIKVGIYNPNAVGGKVYGEMSIYSTLLNVKGISPEFISSLDEILAYDCVIIPSCPKLGTKDQGSFLLIEKEVYNAEQMLRDYVIKEGKGILLYHDSVGFERFATGRPVFPELCSGTTRIQSALLTIGAEHPIVNGMGKEASFEHMYYDHIQMKPGEQGVVVVSDKDNMPVVIAGELGKGRVVLNGTIIFKKNDEAFDKEATGIDKKLLIGAVRWLANRK